MKTDEPDERFKGDELVARLRDIVAQLRAEQGETVPTNEPYLSSRSALKGGLKRGVFRLTRPATRRYDRLATELAAVSVELAEHLQATSIVLERLRGDVDRIDHGLQGVRAAGAGGSASDLPGGSARVPDDYYWAFEGRMRGTPASVMERLRAYERFVVPLRERITDTADPTDEIEAPLWLDLGCGWGELCELVREWGWSVQGVDNSPAAVDACRDKGIDATLADVGEYLSTRRGAAPAGVSAIQLIEHLDPRGWIALFEGVHALLRPGGAFLLETINGLNPQALAAYFIADVTHTWPGHPATLALMAEHAGFASVEVAFCNPDHSGNAQDFAIWAVKAGPASRPVASFERAPD